MRQLAWAVDGAGDPGGEAANLRFLPHVQAESVKFHPPVCEQAVLPWRIWNVVTGSASLRQVFSLHARRRERVRRRGLAGGGPVTM